MMKCSQLTQVFGAVAQQPKFECHRVTNRWRDHSIAWVLENPRTVEGAKRRFADAKHLTDIADAQKLQCAGDVPLVALDAGPGG